MLNVDLENAIQVLEQETKCVNRECNIERSCKDCDLVMPSKEPILDAYKTATECIHIVQEIKKLVLEYKYPKVYIQWTISEYASAWAKVIDILEKSDQKITF